MKDIKKMPKWLIAVIAIIAMITLSALLRENLNDEIKKEETVVPQKVKVTVVDLSTMTLDQVNKWCETNKVDCGIKSEYSNSVPKNAFVSQSVKANETIDQGDELTIYYSLGVAPTTEQTNALNKAETYSKYMNMSKQAIYDQLTSQYGEKFAADAAQYAIDNITADWNANALAKAKTYQQDMNMSKQAIYDQLISQYGEKFTADQAQYAIDHLGN